MIEFGVGFGFGFNVVWVLEYIDLRLVEIFNKIVIFVGIFFY